MGTVIWGGNPGIGSWFEIQRPELGESSTAAIGSDRRDHRKSHETGNENPGSARVPPLVSYSTMLGQ